MSKKPTHRVVVPFDRDDNKVYWHHVGSGWETKNGHIQLRFNSFPSGTNKVLIVRADDPTIEESVDTDVVLADDDVMH